MFGIGATEAIVFGLLAVLLFGKRLPDVARQLGTHYAQLKRVLQEVQSEMYKAQNSVTSVVNETKQQLLTYEDDDYVEPTAPQFEVPEAKVNEDASS